jgi:DEAD/DEAH box helicase domain-containing protein
MDPVDGPLAATLTLLKAALNRGLRTIVYTQSRKLAELLAIWAQNRSGPFADRISAYRAGFLPEERREIEPNWLPGNCWP